MDRIQICYLCLEQKDNLKQIDTAVNKDVLLLIHVMNMASLKAKRIIIVCEDCNSKLEKTIEVLKMGKNNRPRLQSYLDIVNMK
ncbi:hypothetical protein CBL_09677 [Carabus blaptoides fortunei]